MPWVTSSVKRPARSSFSIPHGAFRTRSRRIAAPTSTASSAPAAASRRSQPDRLRWLFSTATREIPPPSAAVAATQASSPSCQARTDTPRAAEFALSSSRPGTTSTPWASRRTRAISRSCGLVAKPVRYAIEMGWVMKAAFRSRSSIHAWSRSSPIPLLDLQDADPVSPAPWRLDHDLVSDLPTHQRLADRRLEADLAGARVGLRRADDAISLLGFALFGERDGAQQVDRAV